MKAFWSGGLVFKLFQSRHFGSFIPQLQATSGPCIFPAEVPGIKELTLCSSDQFSCSVMSDS